jgi:hypothetical protein
MATSETAGRVLGTPSTHLAKASDLQALFGKPSPNFPFPDAFPICSKAAEAGT